MWVARKGLWGYMWQVSAHPPPAAGSFLSAGTKSFPSSQPLTEVIAGHRAVENVFLGLASSIAHALAGNTEILEALPEILPPCVQPSPSRAGQIWEVSPMDMI